MTAATDATGATTAIVRACFDRHGDPLTGDVARRLERAAATTPGLLRGRAWA
jgi:hypothetical protein